MEECMMISSLYAKEYELNERQVYGRDRGKESHQFLLKSIFASLHGRKAIKWVLYKMRKKLWTSSYSPRNSRYERKHGAKPRINYTGTNADGT